MYSLFLLHSFFLLVLKLNIMERKKIAIVGVGLIGGSLAIQLHEKKISSKIIGVDANADHAQQAIELELVDEVMNLDEAIAESDVIILAIPVDTLVSLLPSIMDKICRHSPHVGNRI
jgi:prephenate dehydrogenase